MSHVSLAERGRSVLAASSRGRPQPGRGVMTRNSPAVVSVGPLAGGHSRAAVASPGSSRPPLPGRLPTNHSSAVLAVVGWVDDVVVVGGVGPVVGAVVGSFGCPAGVLFRVVMPLA